MQNAAMLTGIILAPKDEDKTNYKLNGVSNKTNNYNLNGVSIKPPNVNSTFWSFLSKFQ